jgi:hypothetical protein
MKVATALLVFVVAWLLWPTATTQQFQKVEQERWIVSSTPAYKGHPTEQPDSVECSIAGVVPSPTKLVTYHQWRELELDDPCPEGDR